MAETDAEGKTLTLVLPSRSRHCPIRGPSSRTHRTEKSGTFPTVVRCPPKDLKPVRVALKGGGRDQSGTEEIKIAGAGADAATLTIRWRFTAK